MNIASPEPTPAEDGADATEGASASASRRLAAECLRDLQHGGRTLATAESLTCGLIASTLASVPGASAVLRGGLAAYATDIKTDLLGIDPTVVATYGVISVACAEAMALRARHLFGADWAVATTGVAGPDPQDGHPPGEAYVAAAGPLGVRSRALALTGSREQIRLATAEAALLLLRELI